MYLYVFFIYNLNVCNLLCLLTYKRPAVPSRNSRGSWSLVGKTDKSHQSPMNKCKIVENGVVFDAHFKDRLVTRYCVRVWFCQRSVACNSLPSHPSPGGWIDFACNHPNDVHLIGWSTSDRSECHVWKQNVIWCIQPDLLTCVNFMVFSISMSQPWLRLVVTKSWYSASRWTARSSVCALCVRDWWLINENPPSWSLKWVIELEISFCKRLI